ncbi:MAG: hypothetical protein ACRDQA_02880 [Nocardioidaceae bacterium]
MSVECARCGLTPIDLPLEELGLDAEDAADFLFEPDGDQWLCQGCAA